MIHTNKLLVFWKAKGIKGIEITKLWEQAERYWHLPPVLCKEARVLIEGNLGKTQDRIEFLGAEWMSWMKCLTFWILVRYQELVSKFDNRWDLALEGLEGGKESFKIFQVLVAVKEDRIELLELC